LVITPALQAPLSYYAVRVGRQPGVYTNAEDARKQTVGFSGADLKRFPDRESADAYVEQEETVVRAALSRSELAARRHAPQRLTRWACAVT